MNEIKEGSIVFGCWTVTNLIGRGAFGTVYRIRKNQNPGLKGLDTQYAALKVMYIPGSEQEVLRLQGMGLDRQSIIDSFQNEAEKLFQEINIMYPLKGHGNIVGYEDSQILRQDSGIGYVIMIRMELLTPIDKYAVTHPMNKEQTIQLGIDICQALEACEIKHIMHRDIKPDNIFVNGFGSFKLGDFGIARTANGTTMGTMAGTPIYMAPEVVKGEGYNATIDIYSLGLVLYQYLNGGRLPFMPACGQRATVEDVQRAAQKRLSGAAVPRIAGIDPVLNDIVCKACAFSSKDRYQSAVEFRDALRNYGRAPEQKIDLYKTAVAGKSAKQKKMPGMNEERKTKTEAPVKTEAYAAIDRIINEGLAKKSAQKPDKAVAKPETAFETADAERKAQENQEAEGERLRKQADEAYKWADFEEALPLYKQAAELGNGAAHYMIADCYALGEGVEEDEELAEEWYKKAVPLLKKSAEQGNVESQYLYAQCLFYGQGIEEDEEQAEVWNEKAAAQGYKDALKARKTFVESIAEREQYEKELEERIKASIAKKKV